MGPLRSAADLRPSVGQAGPYRDPGHFYRDPEARISAILGTSGRPNAQGREILAISDTRHPEVIRAGGEGARKCLYAVSQGMP